MMQKLRFQKNHLAITILVLSVSMCKSTDNGVSSVAADSVSPDLQKIKIMRSGSQASSVGPVEYFTGKVKVDPLFQPNAPSRTAGAYVTFSPGARSAWHTHPLGQILIVTEGTGLVQQWGEPIQEIRKGDVVWTPPGQRHWHGATPKSSMTHIAIQERLEEKTVNWMEKVSDEEYNAINQKGK